MITRPPSQRGPSFIDQARSVVVAAKRLAEAGDTTTAIEQYKRALRLANESFAAGAHALRAECRAAIVSLGGTVS